MFLLVLLSFPFMTPGEAGAQEEAEIWGMFVNNYWNYRGVDSTGFTWTWSDRIARTDTTTFPGYTTYVSEGRQGGSLRKTEWYSISPTEIRFWRRYFLDEGEWLTATANGGFLWGRYPIIVGDHWAEVKSGTLSGPGFNYAITLYTDITVLGQETVTVDSGTYTAYKTRHIITTVGPNIYDTTTEYYWFVPYLGVVRWESAGNPSETQYLTGYNSYSWRFRDVSASSFAYSQIESVASAGITGGCSSNPPLYCPENTINRAQMAVFMEASLQRSPAASCTGMFSDVNAGTVGDLVCRYIEDFAAAGITGGCGGGNYCPSAPVTRAQMAVFIEAALSATPGATCLGTFSDVNAGTTGDVFCRYIEDFATRGITGGCGGGRYCPNDAVTRAQMAVFLVAAPPPLRP